MRSHEACCFSMMRTKVPDALVARPSVFDLPLSTRPGGVRGSGREGKTKNKKQGGGGGPALRIRPRREKNPDLHHEIS